MAFLQMNYHSDALGIGVSVNVVLPEKAKTLIGMKADGAKTYKTLYLLHGLSDDHSIWMRRTSIERYAADYGIAVVMPTVGRSWYTDKPSGEKYLTFVAKELPSVCRSYFRGMSERREDTLVAGLSMGGYGAVKVALTAPETFGGCASLSGALDVATFSRRHSNLGELRGIFGYDLEDSEQLKGTQHDVFHLLRQHVAAGRENPRTYLWCGESDYLLDHSRRFRDLLLECGVEHCYEESEGDHAWHWWDLHIRSALNYLLERS